MQSRETLKEWELQKYVLHGYVWAKREVAILEIKISGLG
jgi:hypothetical protein